jgi:hypothetical protein
MSNPTGMPTRGDPAPIHDASHVTPELLASAFDFIRAKLLGEPAASALGGPRTHADRKHAVSGFTTTSPHGMVDHGRAGDPAPTPSSPGFHPDSDSLRFVCWVLTLGTGTTYQSAFDVC